MNITALGDVFKAMLNKNYKVYSRPYELNIVGIRSAVNKPNKFDDVFFIFYKNDKNQIIYKIFPCTTDPGTYWLNYPMNPLGTAAVKAGQYIDAYKIGLHRGYTALQQAGDLKVYRDLDRNSTFDFLEDQVYKASPSAGKNPAQIYGLHLYFANVTSWNQKSSWRSYKRKWSWWSSTTCLASSWPLARGD